MVDRWGSQRRRYQRAEAWGDRVVVDWLLLQFFPFLLLLLHITNNLNHIVSRQVQLAANLNESVNHLLVQVIFVGDDLLRALVLGSVTCSSRAAFLPGLHV